MCIRASVSANMSEELRVGQRIKGRVIKLMPFGAFVALENSELVGLVKIPEISWERIRTPVDVLAVGQEIEAEVLAFDADSKRISLSIKRCQSSAE